jgi:hypothetical protein
MKFGICRQPLKKSVCAEMFRVGRITFAAELSTFACLDQHPRSTSIPAESQEPIRHK